MNKSRINSKEKVGFISTDYWVEDDNAKTYHIFGSICIDFYLINTYYYAIFYVYCRYSSVKRFTASKMENNKKERKREENGVL